MLRDGSAGWVVAWRGACVCIIYLWVVYLCARESKKEKAAARAARLGNQRRPPKTGESFVSESFVSGWPVCNAKGGCGCFLCGSGAIVEGFIFPYIGPRTKL